jgi:hypothetical protein
LSPPLLSCSISVRLTLAIQEENLRVQQVMQTDRQRLEDKTSDGNFAIVVQTERKLAIQEEQLRVQQRILTI